MTQNEIDTILSVIASVLWRCFVASIVCLVFSFAVYRLMGSSAHEIFSLITTIEPQEFERIAMAAYAQLKVLSVVAFMFPFLGIQWYLLGSRKDSDASILGADHE